MVYRAKVTKNATREFIFIEGTDGINLSPFASDASRKLTAVGSTFSDNGVDLFGVGVCDDTAEDTCNTNGESSAVCSADNGLVCVRVWRSGSSGRIDDDKLRLRIYLLRLRLNQLHLRPDQLRHFCPNTVDIPFLHLYHLHLPHLLHSF